MRGQTVGRYEVRGLIGHGGTASVYRARHRKLGSEHAMKLLNVHKARIRDRLLQEGRAQARLRHPNITRVTDVLLHEGAPVLVMEFVDGPSLFGLVHDGGPMSLGTAVRIFRGIVRGLRAAHVEGLVHRDLKPGNVLLAHTPDGWLPKLADFGLVKVLASELGVLGPTTRGGAAMGTPEFMAPEQIKDASTVDMRADLFSLGCILYYMVARSPPFRGPNAVAVFNEVLAGRYEPLDAASPGVPPKLREVVDLLLIVDPKQRIQTCDELLALISAPDLLAGAGPGRLHPADALATRAALATAPEPEPPRQRWQPSWSASTPALLVLPLAAALAAVATAASGAAVRAPPPDPVPVEIPVEVPPD